MSLHTQKLVFLGVYNYLPASGFSYAKYLRTYGGLACQGGKYFFPYEYVEDLSYLHDPLPPYVAFYSSLHAANTREEGLGWAHGQQNCAELCWLWVCKGVTSLPDLLVHFNICNVVLALQKQCDIYKEVKLDMLKDCPSLPSIGMRYGMRGSEDLFHTFGQEQANLAEMMNAAIINFPSCTSDTWRSASPPSGHLTMVLSCFPAVPWSALMQIRCTHGPAQDMAIGACHVRSEPDYGLDAEAMYHNYGAWHSRASLQWLAYEAEVRRLEGPLHAGNGPKVWLDLRHLPMDGYHPDTTTMFQFHCCLFHCHDCHEFEDT